MDNELLAICDKLNGYDVANRFEVVKASKNENGLWELLVRNISKKAPEGNEEVTK